MANLKFGPWKSVLIDIDRATEFSGDDVDQYSAVFDLESDYEFVTVMIPTVTSATTGVCVQRNDAVATVPLPVYEFDDDATGDFLHATTAATTSHVVSFRIGGFQFGRIKMGANQAADRTFYVRGYNG